MAKQNVNPNEDSNFSVEKISEPDSIIQFLLSFLSGPTAIFCTFWLGIIVVIAAAPWFNDDMRIVTGTELILIALLRWLLEKRERMFFVGLMVTGLFIPAAMTCTAPIYYYATKKESDALYSMIQFVLYLGIPLSVVGHLGIVIFLQNTRKVVKYLGVCSSIVLLAGSSVCALANSYCFQKSMDSETMISIGLFVGIPLMIMGQRGLAKIAGQELAETQISKGIVYMSKVAMWIIVASFATGQWNAVSIIFITIGAVALLITTLYLLVRRIKLTQRNIGFIVGSIGVLIIAISGVLIVTQEGRVSSDEAMVAVVPGLFLLLCGFIFTHISKEEMPS